jgi:hypothetical protein
MHLTLYILRLKVDSPVTNPILGIFFWSGRVLGLNPELPECSASALPLRFIPSNYHPHFAHEETEASRRRELVVVAHTCNLSTQETEAGGSQDGGQLGYTEHLSKKKKVKSQESKPNSLGSKILTCNYPLSE